MMSDTFWVDELGRKVPIPEELKELQLHIQFRVTAADGRVVDFADYVPMVGLRDWFDRAGMAITSVFVPQGPIGIVCVDGGSSKIAAIKTTRAFTNLGLKEAKDFVEGTKKLVFSDVERAAKLLHELRTNHGCRLETLGAGELNGITLSVSKV